MCKIKVCRLCKRELPANSLHFYTATGSKSSKDGLRPRCRECEGGKFEQPKVITRQGYKICNKCDKELLLENFSKEKVNADGYRNYCKECRAKYSKIYNVLNKDHATKIRNLYLENNKLTISEYRNISYQRNRITYLAKNKKYQKTHREIINKQRAIYRDRNRERLRTGNQARRARKNSLPSTLTTAQWEHIKQCYNNKCAYCGKERALTQEHFIPLNKGGEYTKDNIVPACQPCNSSKQTKPFLEWYPAQPFYTKARETKILKHLGYKQQKQQLSIF